MAVTIRPGGPDDFDDALQIYFVAGTARREGRPIEDWRLAQIRDEIAHPDGWLLMAEDNGQPIGMATAMQSRLDHGAGDVVPGLCYLGLVFVIPERWGEGIGGRLTDGMIEEAKARGFSRMNLNTHENNTRAQRMYEHRGFQRTGQREPSRNDPDIAVEEWGKLL